MPQKRKGHERENDKMTRQIQKREREHKRGRQQGSRQPTNAAFRFRPILSLPPPLCEQHTNTAVRHPASSLLPIPLQQPRATLDTPAFIIKILPTNSPDQTQHNESPKGERQSGRPLTPQKHSHELSNTPRQNVFEVWQTSSTKKKPKKTFKKTATENTTETANTSHLLILGLNRYIHKIASRQIALYKLHSRDNRST